MAFDLDDTCEGLLVSLEDIGAALSSRQLSTARDVVEQLLSDIEDAIAEQESDEDED